MSLAPFSKNTQTYFIEPRSVHSGTGNVKSSVGTLIFKDARKTCVIEVNKDLLAQLDTAFSNIFAKQQTKE